MSTMNEQAKEARRAYKRKWAREHPEMIRAQQRRYWERRAQRDAAEDPEALQLKPEPAGSAAAG